ncbi:MAG TPA: hypothetical protein VFK56_19445 [Mycobacterium sp.]|nr:hypothetical protein [Mycobacterium sp.]
MLKAVRDRLTYANIMATIAVFIALGGTTYAAATLTGRDIKDGSLTGKDLKRNSLTGKQIAEAKLTNPVPRARNAARLAGKPASSYLVRCPDSTMPLANICIESQPRAASTYSSAVGECDRLDRPQTPGRRLPTHSELMAALTYEPIALAPGGELTSNVYPPSTAGGPLEVLTVTDAAGGFALVPNSVAGVRAFRCVSNPIN